MKRFLVIQDSKEPYSVNNIDISTEFDAEDNMIVIDYKYNQYCLDGKNWNPVK